TTAIPKFVVSAGSTKNARQKFLTVNSRLEQAYQLQLGSLHRQHVTAMADWENERLNTSRLLKSIRRCSSDEEPLSVKFLGPPTRKRAPRKAQERQKPLPPQNSAAGLQAPETVDRPKPLTANRLQQPQKPSGSTPRYVERSKTFAAATTAAKAPAASTSAAAPGGRRRQRTPLPTKLERFYTNLGETKSSCGLTVVDATQTEGFLRGSYTLSKADWLEKLARIDPEFFKNVQNTGDDASSSADEEEAEDS
uniref:YL1_C domain-containing protein n=1 Tax=Macrostomum lignano TaxID=282301 RepID=A0A1I8GHP5_9PLAT